MSIVAIGVDLCEINRLSRIISEHGERFLKKVYTGVEIAYCAPRSDSSAGYAARFAAKEALLKALGTGLRAGINWKDIEVVNDKLGKPQLMFYNQVAERIGRRKVFLSLSHTKQNALAFVIIDGEPF